MTAAQFETGQYTAAQFFRDLNYLGQFRRRHPDIPITRPSESLSRMWVVDYGRTDKALFGSLESLASALRTWEAGHQS